MSILVVLVQTSDRLLPVLILLEFLGLCYFIGLAIELGGLHLQSLVLLIFLVVTARESVIGLVLFVLFCRQTRKDYVAVVFSLKF